MKKKKTPQPPPRLSLFSVLSVFPNLRALRVKPSFSSSFSPFVSIRGSQILSPNLCEPPCLCEKPSSPKKVLLVSSIPLNPTGRGMDVLTHCFAKENWETHHLQFPVYPWSAIKTNHPDNIKTHRAELCLAPYVDSLMYFIPGFLFRFLVFITTLTARKINLESFDLIVLESGKSLFLLKSIPEHVRIIYRQSDSVKMVLGRGKHYCALEDAVSARAESIILVKEYYRKSILPQYQHKIAVIENGFHLNKEQLTDMGPDPYKKEGQTDINAVYMGLAPVDTSTLDYLCSQHHNVAFHIMGPCIKKKNSLKKLTRHSNFTYYGYTNPTEYLPRLKYSDFAIVPYAPWPGIDHVGFTTKYLYFMYFNLPIVTFKRGHHPELALYGIKEAENKEDFSRIVGKLKENHAKINYKVNWNYFSSEGRENEYRNYIRTIT
jgi:hypothetical protein